MSANVVNPVEYRRQASLVTTLAFGALAGLAFGGWLLKSPAPAAPAAPAAFTGLDYDRLGATVAAAVKTALAKPEATAPAVVTRTVTKAAPAVAHKAKHKHKKAKAKAAPAVHTVYLVPAYVCSCAM